MRRTFSAAGAAILVVFLVGGLLARLGGTGAAAIQPDGTGATPTIDSIASSATVDDINAVAARLDPPPSRPVGQTHVYVIGDSLTFGAEYFGHVSAKLAAAGYQARVDGKVGRFMSGGAAILQAEAAAGRLEPVVFVALGNNEVANHWSAKYLGPAIDQVLAAAGDRWVIWMNIEQRDPTLADTFNAILAQKARDYRHLLVADWHSLNLTGLFDGPLHMTPSGYVLRADFMVSTLNVLTLPH